LQRLQLRQDMTTAPHHHQPPRQVQFFHLDRGMFGKP
jgi:hypothetical protein